MRFCGGPPIVSSFAPTGSWQYLEEVLDTFGVVAVAFPTDPLHLFDLACLACGLDVFEMDLWVLAEVHDGAQEIEEACVQNTSRNVTVSRCLDVVYSHCL